MGRKRFNEDIIMHCHKCGAEFKNEEGKRQWYQDFGPFEITGDREGGLDVRGTGRAIGTCRVKPWKGKINYSGINECKLKPTKAWKFYTEKEKREAINLTIITLVLLIIIIGFCIWVFG